ncbi:hypothetical protein GF420_13440 [candidate division GN15 bacterium]|nr:hypothetical protein [candidate division GN15 bacterium]
MGLGWGWSETNIITYDISLEWEAYGATASTRGVQGPSWYHYFSVDPGWYTRLAAVWVTTDFDSSVESGAGPGVVIGGGIEPIRHVHIDSHVLLAYASSDTEEVFLSAIGVNLRLVIY